MQLDSDFFKQPNKYAIVFEFVFLDCDRRYIINVGAITALCSSLLGGMLPQPRILMAMGRDGLLPPFFSDINKHSNVPVKSTVVTGLVAATLGFFMDVSQLAGMVSLNLYLQLLGILLLWLPRTWNNSIQRLIIKGRADQELFQPGFLLDSSERFVFNWNSLTTQTQSFDLNPFLALTYPVTNLKGCYNINL